MLEILKLIFFFLFDISKFKERASKGKHVGWIDVIISPSMRYAVIIGLTLGILGVTFRILSATRVKNELTTEQLVEIQSAIQYFNSSTGRYPKSLKEVIGNRPLRKNWDIDKWGRQLIYSHNENGFELTSLGKDGILNTDDDITIETKAYPQSVSSQIDLKSDLKNKNLIKSKSRK